ncbi:MAG: GNAT family N-acetyltransferase [Actinocatenispora sp.]
MSERLVPPSEVLTANGVTLCRWRRGDAAALLASVRASLVHLGPWMPWAVAGYDRAETNEFLTRSRKKWDAGEEFNFAIMTGGRRVIGSAGLMTRVGPGALEIGYWVDVRHTGQGVATRAAAALAAAGLAVPGIDQVEIHHEEANTASAAVPRKLGFQQVGQVRKDDGGTNVVWRLRAGELVASRIPEVLGQRRYAPAT